MDYIDQKGVIKGCSVLKITWIIRTEKAFAEKHDAKFQPREFLFKNSVTQILILVEIRIFS